MKKIGSIKKAAVIAVLLHLTCMPFAGAADTSSAWSAGASQILDSDGAAAPVSDEEWEVICSYPPGSPYRPVSSIKVTNPDGSTTETNVFEYGEREEITWSSDGMTKTTKRYDSGDASNPSYTEIAETRQDGSYKLTSIEQDGRKSITVQQPGSTDDYGSIEYPDGSFATWSKNKYGDMDMVKEFPDGSKLQTKTSNYYDNDYKVISNISKSSMAQKEYDSRYGGKSIDIKNKNAPSNTIVSFETDKSAPVWRWDSCDDCSDGVGSQIKATPIFTYSTGNSYTSTIWKLDEPYTKNGVTYQYANDNGPITNQEAGQALKYVSEGSFSENGKAYALVNYYGDDGVIHKYGLQINSDGSVTNLGEINAQGLEYARKKIKEANSYGSSPADSYTAITDNGKDSSVAIGIEGMSDESGGRAYTWASTSDPGLATVSEKKTPKEDGSVFIERTLANGWKIISVASPKVEDGEDAGADVRTMIQSPSGQNYFAPNSLADSIKDDFVPDVNSLKEVVTSAVSKTGEKLITNPDGTRLYSLVYSDNSTLNYEEVRNPDGTITKIRQVYTDADGNAYDLGYVEAWYNYPVYNAYDMYSNPLWQAMNSSFIPAEVTDQARAISLANMARNEAGKESFPYVPAAAGAVAAAALAGFALRGKIKEGLSAVAKGFSTKIMKR